MDNPFFDEGYLFLQPDSSVNKVSKTTDLVNKASQYTIESLKNIGEEHPKDAAIQNRVEWYNPDTSEERQKELDEAFYKLPAASRIEAELSIHRERNKGLQAQINTSRALIKRARAEHEERASDPSTYEGALAEQYGINTDSTLSSIAMNMFGPVSSALKAWATRDFGGDDPVSLTLNTVLQGRNIDNIRDKFMKASTEEQTAYIKELTDSIVQDGNILTPDYEAKLEMLETLLKDNYSSSEELFDNTFSILDSIGGIPAIKGVAKGTAKGFKSASDLKKVGKVNELLRGLGGDQFVSKGGEMIRVRDFNTVTQSNPAALAATPTQRALNEVAARDALNAKPENQHNLNDIVEAATGNTPEQVILNNNLPTLNNPQAPIDGEVWQQVLDASPELITPDSQSKLIEELSKTFDKRSAGNLDIRLDGNVLNITTTLGTKNNNAFKSLESAKKGIKNVLDDYASLGLREPELTIVGMDDAGNIVDAATPQIDSFYIQVNHSNDITHRMYNPLGEAADMVDSIFDASPITRRLRDNIYTPSQRFAEDLIRPAMASIERGKGLESKLFREDFAALNNNLKGLSSSRKEKFYETLWQQNKNRRAFTNQELAAMGHTEQEIEALSVMRSVNDKSWELKNILEARRLNKAGFKKLNTKFNLYGREATIADTEDIIDAATNTVGKAKDYSYRYELATPLDINGIKYRYVGSKIELKGSTVNPRFDDVIGKIDGYTEMRLKPQQVFLDLDGRTIGVAKSKLDAYEKAKEIVLQGKYSLDDFTIRYGRENDMSEVLKEASLLQSRDDISFINQTALDALEDPIEAMQKGLMNVINDIQLEPVLDIAKRDAAILYRDNMPIKNGMAVFPQSLSEIRGSGENYGKACALFEYINRLQKATPNAIDSTFKQLTNAIADRLGEASINSGGFMANIYSMGEKTMLNVAKAEPLLWARRLTSIAYITTNPLRQFFLQGMQAANMLGVDPISCANGKALGTAIEGMLHYSGLKNNLSKEGGVFIDLVERMGLFNNASAISFVQEALDIGKSSAVKKALVDIPGKGVIYGEKLQQYMQMSALYHKYLRENGVEWFSNRRNVDKFLEQLRIVTGSQTPIETLPYERSAASLIMQFVQSPHKMSMMLFNKEIPASMRARIAMTEAVMFGSGYYGYKAIDHLVDGIEDPEMAQGIQYGAFGLMVNKMFGMVMKTENFAPTDFSGIIRGLINWTDTDRSVWQNLSIPAAGFAKYRVTPVIKDFLAVGGVIDNPDDKTLEDAALDILKLSSGLTAAHRAYIAYNTGNYYDSKGKVLKEGMTGRQSLGLLFGLQPETSRDVEYDLRTEVKKSKSEKRKEMISAYDAALTEINKQFPKGSENDSLSEIRRTSAALGVMAQSFTKNDPSDLRALRSFLNRKMKAALKGEENNMSWFVRGSLKGLNDMNDDMKFQLRRLKSIDPDKYERVRQGLGNMLSGEDYGTD